MQLDLNWSARHQAEHGRALIEGLRRHDINHEQDGENVVVCWGWRRGKAHRAAGRDVLVLERGYLADRFTWSSLAWNGLNGRGEFPEYPDDRGARFRSMGLQLLPWRAGGDYVLIAGQVPGDAALQGRDLAPWYAQQASTAAQAWKLPVKFRPHPLAHRRGPVRAVPGAETIGGDMAAALAGAAVVVTFNSNLGVDAMLAGKLATCDDRGSMIWGINPADRERWAHRLAWKQWRVEEIRSGDALVGVVGGIRG